MLHVSLTISCPACGSRIASDARSCIHCDSMARTWPGPALRPLILPGTVGFSEDAPERSRRDRRIVGTTLAMSVLAAATLIAVRVAEDKRDLPRVIAATLGTAPVPLEPGSAAWVMLPAIVDVAPLDAAQRREAAPVALVDSAAARNISKGPGPDQARESAPRVDRLPYASLDVARAPIVPDVALALSADSAVAPIAVAQAVVPNAVSPPRALAARLVDAPVVQRDSIFATVARRLDASDVRSAVTQFVTALPARTATNGDLMSFYSEGADHRVALMDDPSTVSAALASVRVMFDIKLSKFDAVGRQLTRVLPVSMIVAKRDGDVSASAVTFGAVRKP